MYSDQTQAIFRQRPIKPAPRLRFGIRQKIIAVLVVVLTLAMTTTGSLMIAQLRDSAEHAATQRRTFFTRFVSQSLVYSVVGHDYHTLQLLLDEMTKTREIAYAKVLSDKRNVMAESGRWPLAAYDLPIVLPIEFDGRQVGELTIAFDTRVVTSQIEAQQRRLIMREIVVTVLIALGEFAALSFLIVRPIRLISRTLDTGIDSEGRILRDIPVTSGDEIGRLAKQLNLMRDHLNAANQKLRSRVAAADAQLLETNQTLRMQSEELKRVNEDLRQLAVTDALTGLYNRRQMKATIEAEAALTRRHAHPFSLIAMDIDHFKRVNDDHGHHTGDLALRHIADLLRRELREGDIVGRVGGEEFLIVSRYLSAQEAIQVAEKLRTAIADSPFRSEGREIVLTASFGVMTVTGATEDSIEEHLRAADRALYSSKRGGRNRVTHALTINYGEGEAG